jgi:hypothetical protein
MILQLMHVFLIIAYFHCYLCILAVTTPILHYPILHYLIMHYPIMHYSIMHYPILTHPILHYPILTHPILLYPYHPPYLQSLIPMLLYLPQCLTFQSNLYPIYYPRYHCNTHCWSSSHYCS